MNIRLDADAGRLLTERWHDQVLDVESLRFDEQNHLATFIVTERDEICPPPKSLFKKNSLRECLVTVTNVLKAEVVDGEGEVELYINDVAASSTGLQIICVNGTVKFAGEGLKVEIATKELPQSMAEINWSTPVVDVSWHRVPKKPKS